MRVAAVDTRQSKLYGGLYIPKHTMSVATHYPLDENGKLVSGMTHAEHAQFLRDCDSDDVELPALFEDYAIRIQLGKEHRAFNENFARGVSRRYGYILDRNRSYGKAVEGINEQELVTREIIWSMKDGDCVIGVTQIAPSGMTPELTRTDMERMIKAEGLEKLAALRGMDIWEQGDEIVNVHDPSGYAKFTLPHDARFENGCIIPHSYHLYTPSQNEPEGVGVRYAGPCYLGRLWCFYVSLNVDADYPRSDRSAPLVRGGVFGAKLSREFRFEKK